MIGVLSLGALAAPPVLTEPLRTGAARAQEAAVVVGNEDYAFLPDVPYAHRDADAFYTTMLYTRGIPAQRIHDLRGANREQLLDAVAAAADDAGAGGTVWIYFAGHGAGSPSTGEPLLVGDDAKPDPAVFAQRSVTLGELHEAAGSAQLHTVLDTCFAGVGRGGEELMPGSRFAVPTAMTDTGAVWTGAAPDQVAGPFEAARHGRFTYFLVGAMRGWADGELDGTRDETVTAAEADAYVRRALSSLQVRDQRPVLSGVDPGDWVLSTGASEEGPAFDTLRQAAPAEARLTAATTGRLPPLTHVRGSLYQDAAERPVAWLEVRTLAEQRPVGLQAVKARRRNTWTQIGVTALAAEFLLAGPLLLGMGGAECKTGDCTLRDAGIVMTAVGAAAAGWEVGLVLNRRKQTHTVVETANDVLAQ